MHLKKIKTEVQKIFKVDPSNTIQKYDYLIARQTYYYIALKTTDHGKEKIGKFVGKDHATVINAQKKLEANLRYDKVFRQKFKTALQLFKVKNDYEELCREEIVLPVEYNDLSDEQREVIQMITDIPEEHLPNVKMRLKPMIAMLK